MQDLWQIFVWPLLLSILALLITLIFYFAPGTVWKRLLPHRLSTRDGTDARDLEIREQTLRSVSLELHDKVGHLLTVALLQMETCHLNQANAPPDRLVIKRLLTEALDAVRHVSSSLSADHIPLLGLPQAIRKELDLLRCSGHIQTELLLEGEQFFLSEEKEFAVFRIFQEILTNIIRHSRATQVTVLLFYSKNSFRLRITDNGTGFDVGIQLNKRFSNGRGLSNIIKRSRMVGGIPEINSRKNEGTTISLTIPVSHGKLHTTSDSHRVDR